MPKRDYNESNLREFDLILNNSPLLRTFVYFSIDNEQIFCYDIENEQMFKRGENMNKKYRITSKFRFTMFLVVMILCLMTAIGTLLGFNTVNSASMNQYNQVQVEAGDTIWNIACEYAPDDMDVRKVVHDICDINEIQADQLTAGQKIIVPVY